MINVNNVSLGFGKRMLFKEVNIKFNPGNCYGLIGANGSGKSTFLKILSGEIEADTGEINIPGNLRMAVLQQNHFLFDESRVIDTVIMGHKKLYAIMTERNTLYEKADFSEADGIRASELEGDFAEMGGWEAESEAGILLNGLGISDSHHEKYMKDLEGGEKVRVLIAQALFGNPDILIMDEPTNHLDLESIKWLEGFLYDFKNLVIVVSHDRHFLNQVCTHIADIDYSAINMYVGNYDFWYQTSQLLNRQKKDDKKKAEDKAAELKTFIARFSSNAARSKQATSRQKILDKLDLESLKPSSRKFPYVAFKPDRECGKSILTVKGLSYKVEGSYGLDNFEMVVQPGEKIAFLGDAATKTQLFEILSGNLQPDSGTMEWGSTITTSYFPKDFNRYFLEDENLVDWLRPFAKQNEQDETTLRGFLGRMLFSGDETQKPVKVLSGGEKVRCVLSKMMLTGGNVLIMDEPTNHLDLESITSLNEALQDFKEVLLIVTHDHALMESTANRIIELTPSGWIDRKATFEDYLSSPEIQALRDQHYHGHTRLML
ncbi:MAG: ABC transporter ATP-binding protein [Spirochaetes bacterium GWB1_48_6]|nr:MAG: ABC transporter ATP-binding protein [Spirochaetes bacterium GWB1_48_6]